MAQDPNFIRLRSDSLFEKYGFDDGDLLSNHSALEDYFFGDDLECTSLGLEDAILLVVVERFLVPELNKYHKDAQVRNGFNGLHNDVRLVGIDDWWIGSSTAQTTPELVPEYVDVPIESIKRICEAVLGA